MKEIILSILLMVLMVWGFFYATSAEVWNAGEHTVDCSGGDCECYKKLVAADR